LALRIQSFCLPPNGGDCLQQNPSCGVSSVGGSGAGVKELVFTVHRLPGALRSIHVTATEAKRGLAGADVAVAGGPPGLLADGVLALGQRFLMLGGQEDEVGVGREGKRRLFEAEVNFVHRETVSE